MSTSGSSGEAGRTATVTARRLGGAGKVLVVTSVMFTFISFWRAAAIVLCDLASTAYYIGGIVESQIGKAAPWFILGVMLFSYAVRSVYIESCSMFVRGGVYKIVKEALGNNPARVAVSALLFDYILTGPISATSAGQYLVGLLNDLLGLGTDSVLVRYQNYLAAIFAIGVTIYFWRVNIRGIHESSTQALRIMGATTVMGAVMIVWCGATLILQPETRQLPTAIPDLSKKVDAEGHMIPDPFGKQVDPLGFLGETRLGRNLRPESMAGHWFGILGLIGVTVAFGHSILAMSGEETLAQVYREVESPKLRNFKRAAFVVFVYSLMLTSLISFFAVMIIPDDQRTGQYAGNLIGGLAMNVVGPRWAKLALNALVVGVGSLILSGAVNTAIIGSNGVLNRVSEDGVLPDWFLKPHPKYGTTSRLINLVCIMQIVTIVASRGNVLTLGEAYAFGVVWSFVFMTGSMLVLRFNKPGHREYEVPLNIKAGKYEYPVGIALVFFVLAIAAVANLLTKEVATLSGVGFTAAFFAVFWFTEHAKKRRAGKDGHHEHLEHFNQEQSEQVSSQALGLSLPFRKLVSIRSPHNLDMLRVCLGETDPETTDVVVMTAGVIPPASGDFTPSITEEERALLTAVVNMAEHEGKPVKTMVVPTNEPFFAMAQTARMIGAQELFMGASNKFSPDDQLDMIALYWMNVCKGDPQPMTLRVLGRGRDVRLDIAGGSQVPRPGQLNAEAVRMLAELRASWHGVGKLLLAYDGSPLSADFLDTVLSFLDPAVSVTLIDVIEDTDRDGDLVEEEATVREVVRRGIDRARELGREVAHLEARGQAGQEIVRAAVAGKFDAIFMSLRGVYRRGDTSALAPNTRYVLENAPCRVILGFAPKSIPSGAADPEEPARP
ncbi:MAG: amino acid permease [Isosphaeraceae bacterium]